MNVRKNGIIVSGGFSNLAPVQDMETTSLSDGSLWARIFMHNCVGGTVLFSTYAEIMNTQTENKYSRLYLLDLFKAEDDKFEFMLCYPDDTTNYNRWKQSNNPCNEYKGNSDGSLFADGYEAIHIDWSTRYWGGLTRQNSGTTSVYQTFLSGTVGNDNWYYAVGCTTKYSKGIPSYDSTAGRCELWVRIDTLPKQTLAKVYEKFITCRDFLEM